MSLAATISRVALFFLLLIQFAICLRSPFTLVIPSTTGIPTLARACFLLVSGAT